MQLPGFPSRGPRLFALVLAVAVVLMPAASAATLPPQFTETQVASGLAWPTAMAVAPDGRIFVAEQGGKLRVIKNGTLLTTPFVSLTVNSAGERGLLGVAFDPAFAGNGYVYVYYTATTPNVQNRVSRFTANGDVAAAGSEVVILDLDPLSSATNHNGGALHFGADGKLYVAVGDNANGANAQTLGNLHGKVLRIDPDGSIPTDNPFYGSASGQNRAIWALGLRNPFTFSFQRGSSRMFINDVGESSWEEVNDGIAGSNYGWPATEGATSDPRFRSPVYSYGHGSGCAITGGAFYNPATVTFPSEYVGDYFFADYCSGWIRRLDPADGNTVSDFAAGIEAPVDLKVEDDGSLLYLARGFGATGAVYRVAYSGSQAPSIGTHPASQTVSAGEAATFTVSASGSPPLQYQWQRNGVDIAGATSSSYTLASAQPEDDGAKFRVRVSNSAGAATSNEATLTVTSSTAPTAAITDPAAGSLYSGAEVISYAGTGTDAEDGTLPASAFTWRVDFHHDTHVHPFIEPWSGATSGSFTVPTAGHTDSNVWYRIHLTVQDSDGRGHSTYRDVMPRTSTVTLTTDPAGLQLTLDGQPRTAPVTFEGVVGIERTVEAVSPQTAGGKTYEFASWSDGGTRSHTISTPATNTTYTATFTETAAGARGLSATYYDTANLTGAAVTRTDATVDFDWGWGEPIGVLEADTFSVRWTGTVEPQHTGTYTFYTQSDDGVRLWVDGSPLVDNWTDHAFAEDSGTISLTAGVKYELRMEFYEAGGVAVARLLWSGPSTAKAVVPSNRLSPTTPAAAGQGMNAEYYGTADLTGQAVMRTDATVDFDWGSGEPISGLGPDTFSVRWTGTVEPQHTGTYTFYTQSDDGVRLWVDGSPLVDNWTDHARTEDSGTISLTAGVRYEVRMEFYEAGGEAVARLLWSGPSTAKAVVPSGDLSPELSAKINFQPAAAPVPTGYVADSGLVFGLRSNGDRYGWDADNSLQTRDRNSPASPDQRYDTFTHLQKAANPNAVWEIAVPDGTYTVRLVAGDPEWLDSVFRLNVEGVLALSGTPTASNHWIEATVDVSVTDGRLTIGNAAGASNNKLCFVEIS